VGAVDSYRNPLHLDLNLAIERTVTVRGYRFALRGGMDNLTDRANPTAVNNVTGTPQFLQSLDDEGRHFVVRVRFFWACAREVMCRFLLKIRTRRLKAGGGQHCPPHCNLLRQKHRS